MSNDKRNGGMKLIQLQVTDEAAREIADYCDRVKARLGVIKQVCISSLLLEAIRRDLAKVGRPQ